MANPHWGPVEKNPPGASARAKKANRSPGRTWAIGS